MFVRILFLIDHQVNVSKLLTLFQKKKKIANLKVKAEKTSAKFTLTEVNII